MDASFFRSKREPFSCSERRLPVDDDAVAKVLTLRMKEIKACFAKEMVHTHTHTKYGNHFPMCRYFGKTDYKTIKSY